MTISNEALADPQLVYTLLDSQPQPLFWMTPVWNDRHSAIIDFEYRYCNQEMYAFSGFSAADLIGKRISNTITLKPETKQEIFDQILKVYTTGERVESTIFNPVFNKYYGYLRSRVADGVLTIIQDRSAEYRMIGELENQKSLLDNVLKSSPSGISVIRLTRNTEGRVVDGPDHHGQCGRGQQHGFGAGTVAVRVPADHRPGLPRPTGGATGRRSAAGRAFVRWPILSGSYGSLDRVFRFPAG